MLKCATPGDSFVSDPSTHFSPRKARWHHSKHSHSSRDMQELQCGIVLSPFCSGLLLQADYKITRLQETLFKVDFQIYNRITLAIGYFVDKHKFKTVHVYMVITSITVTHPVNKVYMGGVNLRLSVNCLYD